jgi:ATP-dependent RNA helicase RhlE
MGFAALNLHPPLLRALAAEGYTIPTPIQQQAIPHVLAGRDLLGIAQTGTGKTAAFALPILQRLGEQPPRSTGHRVLVLAPTRELAAQIGERFTAYGRETHHRCTVIFGGVGQDPQVRELRRPAAVLVATPGRLLDLIQQRHCSLAGVEILVLDEADRMLDMGFLPDVRRVLSHVPTARQTLFFSATMPPEVDELSKRMLKSPVRVEVTPAATTVEKVAQSIFFVEKADKRRLLVEMLQHDHRMKRVLVFTRTKHGANRVTEWLDKAGIGAAAIHGNKGQGARERALAGFKEGTVRVLVATDIAARGIDVDEITHVLNFDLPNIPESYVHRIGRTARAGASGIALSFCDADERAYLIDIERLIRMTIPRVTGHPYASHLPPPPAAQAPAAAAPSRPQPAHQPVVNPSRRSASPPVETAGRRRRGRRPA